MPADRPELLSFLYAIKETPEDDNLRMILADWLSDNGEEERARYIRGQCRVRRQSPDAPGFRETNQEWNELLARRRRDWLGPLAELHPLSEPEFTRGLIRLTCSAEVLLAQADQAVQWVENWAWVERVQLRNLLGVLDLLHHPVLGQITGLELEPDPVGLGDEGVRTLLASPYLEQLLVLDLDRHRLGPAAARILADAEALTRLRRLCLSYNRIGDRGVQALAGSPHLGRLTSLYLNGNMIGESGAQALLRSPYLNRLAFLGLWNNPIREKTRDLLRERFGSAARL